MGRGEKRSEKKGKERGGEGGKKETRGENRELVSGSDDLSKSHERLISYTVRVAIVGRFVRRSGTGAKSFSFVAYRRSRASSRARDSPPRRRPRDRNPRR